jgi:cytochrome P450
VTASQIIPKPHWLWGSGRNIARAPHLFFAGLAQNNGGFARFRILHRQFVTITDPDLVHHVLVTGSKQYGKSFHHRNLGIIVGAGLIASEGDIWRKNRRQVQPSFRPDAMTRMVPAVCRAVGILFEEWDVAIAHRHPFSAGREMQRLTLLAMGQMLFSADIPAAEGQRLGATLRESLLFLRKRNLSLVQLPLSVPITNNRNLLRCKSILDDFVDSFITARLGAPQEELPDMLNALIAARDPESGDPLSHEELVDQTKSLLLAGYETTGVALCWALYLIARHPPVAERLEREVDTVLQGRLPGWEDLSKLAYTAQVIHETLRLYPPLYTTARQCLQDDTVGTHTIRKGCVVVISIYGMHRNSSWGDQPEAFRPERFASGCAWPKRAFLPFSNGKHICLGNHFAVTEMMVALAMIVQRYRLTYPDDRPVEATGMVGLVPSRDVLLEVTQR